MKFNKEAFLFNKFLSDNDIIALRSWTVNLSNPKSNEYIPRNKALNYILKSNNIKLVSQNFIKHIIGNKKFKIYRAYTKLGNKKINSYSISKKEAIRFGWWKNIDEKIITFQDVIAVPAISFKNWNDASGYINEKEIII